MPLYLRRTNLVNFPKPPIILKNQIITTLSSMNESCMQYPIEFQHCSWQLELFRNISRFPCFTEKCLKKIKKKKPSGNQNPKSPTVIDI